MKTRRIVPVLGGIALLVCSSLVYSRGDGGREQLTIDHSNCSYFGADRDKVAEAALRAKGIYRSHVLSTLTSEVQRAMNYVPPGKSTHAFDDIHAADSIDSYIDADFKTSNITPAPMTTDWEFVRRVTLDLTGRIPTPQTVLSFVASADPLKRAKYIDQLLAAPEWVDKWTMFYGDLLKNTETYNTTGLQRFAQGRNALYQYIHDSLAASKPYNAMVTDLIASSAGDSYTNGPINWLVGGYISTGPGTGQDTFDQMTANVADTFLGITYVNCLLCHNGAGHLTGINLWGSQTTRYQAWQLSSFVSHTMPARVIPDSTNTNVYYWSLQDNTKGFTTDYALNTTSGNRPARVAPAGCKAGQPCYYVAPQYIFNGDTPSSSVSYRANLARDVTGDFQFARAAVNYLWAYFFGQGIVDPPDTFDPARLDPDNPPPSGWTLQPTNAKLLNALATHFVLNGYDLKATMREIVNSQTYQLSSRYPGAWNEAWDNYFARKFVRRLWSEEVHDAVTLSSGLFPSAKNASGTVVPGYTMTGFTDQGYPQVVWAMQLPDVVAAPGDGVASPFMDTFLRGNRDDQPRKQDGSILQALNLMNSSFVEARLAYSGSAASPLIAGNLTQTNANLVNTLFLSILSRYPTSDESTKALASLSGAANRSQAVQNLVWSLYNKVDFVFNY
jgi:hypothetical protein